MVEQSSKNGLEKLEMEQALMASSHQSQIGSNIVP
jgi:hypothetical protein